MISIARVASLLSFFWAVQAGDFLGGVIGGNGCLPSFCVCTNEVACQLANVELNQCIPCGIANVVNNCNFGSDLLCPCSISDFNSACSSSRSEGNEDSPAGGDRRLRAATRILRENDEAYKEYIDACGEHEYEVFLYAKAHIYAIGSPKDSVAAGNCPHAAVHAIFGSADDIKTHARKELLIWGDTDEFEKVFAGETLSIGTFTLLDIARAFEESDASSEGAYDIITNNCAGFLLKMASSLGVEVDTRVTSYVAKSIVANVGKDFYDMIRNNVNFSSLFPSGGRHLRAEGTTSDQDLIQLLVEKSVSDSK